MDLVEYINYGLSISLSLCLRWWWTVNNEWIGSGRACIGIGSRQATDNCWLGVPWVAVALGQGHCLLACPQNRALHDDCPLGPVFLHLRQTHRVTNWSCHHRLITGRYMVEIDRRTNSVWMRWWCWIVQLFNRINFMPTPLVVVPIREWSLGDMRLVLTSRDVHHMHFR